MKHHNSPSFSIGFIASVLAPLFLGGGIALLILPAFAPEIGLCNLLGIIPVAVGILLANSALSEEA